MRRAFTTDDLKTRTEAVTDLASELPIGIGGSEEEPAFVLLSYDAYVRLRHSRAVVLRFDELPDEDQRAFLDNLDRSIADLENEH